MFIGTVQEIWRYPVSSFAGERLASAALAHDGMVGDRQGAFYECESGKVVFPGVVRKWNLAPRIAARTSASGRIEISQDGRTWQPADDPVMAQELAAFCGTAVEYIPYGRPHGDGISAQRYAFSPLHVLSVQALEALRKLLPGSVIDARRFRPNLVVDLPGLDGPTPENRLIGTEFTVGNLRLRGLRASGRCSFTTLAQQDLAEDHAVLRTLIRDFEKNFGIYCDVLEPGEVAVGDSLSLAEPQRPILIAGAGQAGAMLAKTLRDLGCRQPIRILGDERHMPYERPPLSKSEPAAAPSPVLPASTYGELDIQLDLGTQVAAIDRSNREVVAAGGQRHRYDRLVLATGGSARRLPVQGHGRGLVHVVRTADDAAALQPLLVNGVRVAIVGAGWLGLEIAAAARLRGCDVTVFARQNRVLNRSVPAEVAEFILARHRSEGVAFRLGEIPGITVQSDGIALLTGTGVERADVVVIAIGIVPNDQLAREAGLATDDGIVVGPTCQTTDPNIFALGDVARVQMPGGAAGLRIESWHNANDQARILARRLMSLPPEPPPVPRFWSAQYDMMIQIAGLPDPAAKALSSDDGLAPFWDFGSFVVAVNRPRDIRQATARLAPSAAPVEAPALPPLVAKPASGKRISIGPATDFPEDVLRRIEVDRQKAVLVVRNGGVVRAVDDLCPHAAASLAEGFVEGGRIVCPIHFAEFDLRSGQAFNAPPGCGHLRCHGIEQEGGELFLLI